MIYKSVTKLSIVVVRMVVGNEFLKSQDEILLQCYGTMMIGAEARELGIEKNLSATDPRAKRWNTRPMT